MPRYKDDWLIDRVLFDYVSGGSCACCGSSFQSMLFLPNGTQDLISAVSDLETDSREREISALDRHPWPKDLRDQVWIDRVKLRQKMKREMRPKYGDFWKQQRELLRRQQQEGGPAAAPAMELDFRRWLVDGLACPEQTKSLRRIFQLPRQEILELLRAKYDIHSAYGVVMTAAVEQVAFFGMTSYEPDGRGVAELAFETMLAFDRRRGGFAIRLLKDNEEEKEDGEERPADIDERAVDAWLKRMESLAGPKLLERGPSKAKQSDDDDSEDSDDEDSSARTPTPPPLGSASKSPHVEAAGPSFQSDRRMVRLLIARYWADLLQERYLSELRQQQEQQEPEAEEPAIVS